ncbi:DUF427 domain-containing protein [Burkholderia thailandensis]|uniref:DUF427 domain-containing protein n=1 Tax=Burkholderia thailandensis TaxID=57975 RepID=A0AAW9CP17_BURTH|nr:DUF427 domain-containing protein [Burkholderia thailandensis]AHI67484.1 hypothetical protein BTL_4478 [Burkholderia thailandensis H0587]AIP65917.1 hypothetical protein DR62_4164 [Burkholderia thailandensis]AOI55202.1 hypothetical protein WI24_25880 [Burkholderia thailandensis]AOJ54233.1 hypothetical protein AQ475_26040 [Burkholderia thailandensis]AVR27611.1 DUF427 domain-containing protein [Burkholderia thailandensis]
MTQSSHTVKIPGPDHPITIEATGERVVVKAAGQTLADTRDALTLREASYPPVQYVPRKDVDLAQLERTTHESHCPYKGDASYYSIKGAGARGVNAIWSYETPHDAVKRIAGHLAFYPDRVDSITIG